MYSMTNLNVKKACVSLVCLLSLMILTVRFEGREMVYYAPDAEFKLRKNLEPAVNKPHGYINPKSHIVPSSDYSTLSTRAKNFSSPDLIPKNDREKIVEKYKEPSRIMSANFSLIARKPKHTQTYTKINDGHTLNENYPLEQKERIDRIKRICANRELLRDYVLYGYNRTRFYYSSNYNFSYCKVPKSGSTFWTQIFGILKYGVTVSDEVFSRKRSSVHHSMSQFVVNFSSYSRKHSLTVLVSRDPFSRLYSAYIDKSYLQLSYATNIFIRQLRPIGPTVARKRQCPADVTFQEFLDFIILTARQNRLLNRHWAPIYSLCRPCDVNAYILVKQESFSKDTELALQAFGVEKTKLDVIRSALHDHIVETAIPGVIETVYNKTQDIRSRTCMGGRNIAMRLWTSFKIQGYLKETLEFPSKMFESEMQYKNATYVSQVILKYIDMYKMTPLEMKTQRQKALADAYREIKEETIDGIKKLYKIDFEMFGYSTVPPVET